LWYGDFSWKLDKHTPEFLTIERMIDMVTSFSKTSNPNCELIKDQLTAGQGLGKPDSGTDERHFLRGTADVRPGASGSLPADQPEEGTGAHAATGCEAESAQCTGPTLGPATPGDPLRRKRPLVHVSGIFKGLLRGDIVEDIFISIIYDNSRLLLCTFEVKQTFYYLSNISSCF